MAGSYRHCVDEDGCFLEDWDDFTNMIENVGDAYEACEMMCWMIHELSGCDPNRIKEIEELYYAVKRGEVEERSK